MIKLKTWIKILFVFCKRVYRFSIDFILICTFILFNVVRYRKIYDKNILFVTAAEKNYYSQLENLLSSFYSRMNEKILVFNLGLEEKQINNLMNKYTNLEIRNFDFTKYPNFISEYEDGKLGSYAWKPIIVNEVLREFKQKVVWLDAGNIITRKIIFLKISLTTKGLVVPTSSNRISDWTHPKTVEYIGIDKKYLRSNNYASGLVGFDYSNSSALKISNDWSKFAKIKECIAPRDSSRLNHRQDQAILTLLLYKYFFRSKIKKFFHPQTNFIYGVMFHKRKIYNF